MFTLKSLRIRDFRGFLDTDAGSFVLDSPITILFGQNGCGKSSTLNAIEWGLFGNECSGTKTNIRERVGWVVANQHANPGEVAVELQIHDGLDGDYLIRRKLNKRARRKNADGEVEVELPDGECLTGSKAALLVERFHRSTFRDFATTVYQHQEVIRAIVTQEPRDRGDAIDRLLGLSDHRNLLNALNKVNAKARQRDFLETVDTFARDVGTVLSTHEKILEERRTDATQAGVSKNKLNFKATLTFAREVQQTLAAFATEAGLELVSVPVPQEREEIKAFYESVRKSINRFRGEIPAAKEQGDLVERRRKITGLKSDLDAAKRKQAEIGNGIRALDTKHKGQNSVAEQLDLVKEKIENEKTRLRETNARASLINEAINFLEAEEARDQSPILCPVCGHEASGLLEKLRRQWKSELQAQAGYSQATIASLQTEETCLQIAASNYKTWNDKLKAVAEELTSCCQQAGELLAREIKPEDDPLALLNDEAGNIEGRLEVLKRAINEKQTRLDDIAQQLEKIRIIDDILHLEEKQRILEEIQQSPEYKELEACRDCAAELVDDLESIRVAMSEVMNEEARDKLSAAQTAIDQYFRQMTDHPAISAIKLTVDTDTRTQRNDYAIADQAGNDLTPILSQGDLNALALAIFLGLAASTKDSNTFGFLLLDDPTQSLDSKHKKQLVQVLNEVACRKQLILSTMDREFRDYLTAGLTKTKKEYVFEAWTPEKGPTITPV